MSTQGDQRPSTYDLVVVSDQVVLGERLVPAGIAIVGEKIAAILDADLARRPGWPPARST